MDYNVLIPVYLGGEVVDNLLATMDVSPSHVMLIDNSPTSYCKKFEGRGYTILFYPDNLGLSRSWNIGLKAGRDWTFILTQAAVFPNGFSEFLLGVNPIDECYLTVEGWHVFGLTKKVTDKIGFADENIWPAYGEDWDLYRRMCLGGIIHGEAHKPPVHVTSVGSSSGQGQKINFNKIHEYLTSKWGGGFNDTEDKLWKLPFKDKQLDYFPNRSLKEVQNIYAS